LFLIFSPRYHIDIGLHVFPTLKYQLVYTRLRTEGLLDAMTVREPSEASWEELALVHTAAYLQKARTGAFTQGELAQLELPWSPGVAEGFRLMCGGTLLAGRLALQEADASGGLAVHLGGGFHHAFADHGEGFCLFNDVAVAVRVLHRDRVISRAAIVDLDVHHGNGTAAIFGGDATVFTFSLHHEQNYPAYKPPGSLDIGLDGGTGDDTYLARLADALPAVTESCPDVMFYLAGADPYEADQLGGLALTMGGLRRRDQMVIAAARTAGVPLVIVLAGGYARDVNDTVAIHLATVREALSDSSRGHAA
jgi:acetoin utilization deacetylase AcuC-like enzyme